MGNKIYIDQPLIPGRELNYTITVPAGGWRRSFDADYAEKMRPIAETLAMLDGNAFTDSWQNYLPEADAVYRNNGGDDGWASQCGWIKQCHMIQKDPTLKDQWDKLQVLLALKENKNGNV
jgi:hypothetical protein